MAYWALLIPIGFGFVVALHGILALRWAGQWTQNRRLIWWVFGLLAVLWMPALFVFSVEITESVVGPRSPLGYTLLDPNVYVTAIVPWAALSAAYVAPLALTIGRAGLCAAPAVSAVVAGAICAVDLAFVRGYTYDDVRAMTGGIAIIVWFALTLSGVLFLAWRIRRARILASDTRCLDCDYELVGVPEARCPECGARIGEALLARVRAAEGERAGSAQRAAEA